jgi:hypothetical protein
MQNTVGTDAPHFVACAYFMDFSVFLNSIYRYEEISRNNVINTVIEGDDVRVVMVIEGLHVDLQEVLVRAQNNSDFANPKPLTFNDLLKPRPRFAYFSEPVIEVHFVERDACAHANFSTGGLKVNVLE